MSAGNQATFTYIVTNNGPDLATNITVTDNLSQAVTRRAAHLCFGQRQLRERAEEVRPTPARQLQLPPLQAGSTATVTIVRGPALRTAAGARDLSTAARCR